MPNLFESVLRADDFLYCQFEFVNLVLGTSNTGAPQFSRVAAGPAFIVLRLPPQNIAEQVAGENAPGFPHKGGLAGPSRLTFRLSDAVTQIDYRLDALLAQIGSAELVETAAGGLATAIEWPDRLLLVPRPSARLAHRTIPFTSPNTGVTEIWHSDLGDSAAGTFKAIANPADTAARPFNGALTKQNRDDIVTHCRRSVDPHVIESSVFSLTALGATARLKSKFRIQPDISLAAWEQQTWVGRDQYAHTLEQGYLFPFGHRATIATVTERVISSQVAELAHKNVLTVVEAERSYVDLADLYPGRGREMPFVRIRVASAPQEIADTTAPIRVDLVMTDRAGNRIDCSANVFFVSAGAAATGQTQLAALNDRYLTTSVASPDGQPIAMPIASLGNQRVAVADDDGGRGDTSLNVDSLTFGVKLPSELQASAVPAFLPFMQTATARIPALEQMIGTTTAGQRQATAIAFHENYLASGFVPGDRKQVFAKFAAIPGISIPAERAGGLAAPRFPAIDGLSRLTGPVSKVAGLAATGSPPLTPEELVGETKLLGMIPLKDILALVAPDADLFPVENPVDLFSKVDVLGEAITPRPVMTTVADASGVETRFVWKPRIKDDGLPAPLERIPARTMELILKGRITKSVRSPTSPPAFSVIGTLRNFQLSFLGVLAVRFASLEFVSEAQRKVDVKLNLDRIDFTGILAFVRKLQEWLPTGNLGGAPVIQTLPDGVVVRSAIPLPAVPLGALSIQNVALSSSVSLPFVEGVPAAVRFALSERNNPFLITVSIFGGTGFFAVEVRTSTQNNLMVEAALEFGGIASLNLVVVKGGIYLLAGVYVSMKSDGGPLIEGHLRFGGYVDVLGLVSVSVEFYIALAYIPARNVLYGTGRLTVGVKVAFFSESFSFAIEKEIPGFGEAPADHVMTAALVHTLAAPLVAAPPAESRAPEMTAAQWEKYCAAFA